MTNLARILGEAGRGSLVLLDELAGGTDPEEGAALACAVMHCAFRDGHVDREYLQAYTDFPADLEAHLASRGPAWAAAITRLPEVTR